MAAEFQLELRTEFSPKSLVVDNKDGVWFPNDDAEYLLRLRTDTVPGLVGAINSQQHVIDGLDLQLKLKDDKIQLQDQKVQVLQSGLDATQKRLDAEVKKNSGWYNDKKLWGLVGFLAGVALTGYLATTIK